MSSCTLGHSVSPGTESCEICGDDLRRLCSQGHASRAGALFCEKCGEMLPLAAGEPAMAAAAPLTMDYSSGSFADFIEGGEDVPGPGGPGPAVAPAEPIPEAEPVRPPDLVTGPAAHQAPEPEPPAPEPMPPAPEPVPPAPKATRTPRPSSKQRSGRSANARRRGGSSRAAP